MTTLAEIERLTKEYSDLRGLLAERVDALQDEIELLKRQKLPGIKNTLGKVAEAEAKLKSAIEENPDNFSKPRTVILHGIKIGFKKSKGSIAWEDSDTVIRLIKKYFSGQADVLIRTTETPNKPALAELSAAELKKIGVTVEETGDAVIIKPVDGEVEKIVDILLKGAAEEAA